MNQDVELITPEMLEGLPEPVQRYLTYTGVIGKPRVQTVRLTQSGRFRRGEDQPWMPMTAEQFYTVDPPGFVWKARFKMFGLPLMRARDTYRDGEGHMYARLAQVIPIFDVRSQELTQGAMVRYLQEMMWFPVAYLEPYIKWKAVDEASADVTFADHGKSVTGRMHFDAEGRVTNFIAERYRELNGEFILNTWSTPIDGYGKLAGLNLPVRGRAIWKLDTGDLTYAELEILSVEYNESTDELNR